MHLRTGSRSRFYQTFGERDGRPRHQPDPEIKTNRITGPWCKLQDRVAAARGDRFVRHDHTITREFQKECREPGPLYRMSSLACYELGFAGVALGLARASLDVFVDVARNKIPRGMKSPIRDNAVVQSDAAQAEVRVRAARAFLLQTIEQIWKDVTQPDGVLTLEHRMTLRMASTHAIHTARNAVDFAYNAAGTTAIFESHPLERRFRDMHTVTQQLQGRLSHFETVGAYLLGGDPDLTFV